MPHVLFEHGPLDGHTEDGQIEECCTVDRFHHFQHEKTWPVPTRSCDRDAYGYGEWVYHVYGSRIYKGVPTTVYRWLPNPEDWSNVETEE